MVRGDMSGGEGLVRYSMTFQLASGSTMRALPAAADRTRHYRALLFPTPPASLARSRSESYLAHRTINVSDGTNAPPHWGR